MHRYIYFYSRKCAIPSLDFFPHLDEGRKKKSSCRGLSTCLHSALSHSSPHLPPPLPPLPLCPLSFTRSVLEFSPSPGLGSSHRGHHHHHLHHFRRVWRHGWREGGSVQQAIRPFVSSLCKGVVVVAVVVEEVVRGNLLSLAPEQHKQQQ